MNETSYGTLPSPEQPFPHCGLSAFFPRTRTFLSDFASRGRTPLSFFARTIDSSPIFSAASWCLFVLRSPALRGAPVRKPVFAIT